MHWVMAMHGKCASNQLIIQVKYGSGLDKDSGYKNEENWIHLSYVIEEIISTNLNSIWR